MTMTDKNIQILNDLIGCITLYVPFVTIIAGTMGGLCNILTFSSKKLRYNSCVFYFLCSTIFDLIYLLLGGITSLMGDHYSHLLPDQSVLFCKCRTYIVVVIPSLSTYFLMLASIDRCLSTSTSIKWRKFSQINFAWRIAIVTIIISFISTSHILFLFELQRKDVNNDVYKCVPHRGIYTIFFSVCLLSTSPFLVYTIMFSCSLITLIRIRALRCRTGILFNRRRRHRNIDRHLITIMFVQVGLGTLLTFFRCGFLAYSFSTINIKKTLSRSTIESFLNKLSLVIYYMNFAKSFPVNTLTSPLFQQVFRQRINNLFKQIYPFTKGISKTISSLLGDSSENILKNFVYNRKRLNNHSDIVLNKFHVFI